MTVGVLGYPSLCFVAHGQARTQSALADRLRIILAEKNKTGKWLAEQLGKDPSTISKWCSNSSQPQLDTVIRIAELLEVDIKELINR